MKNHQYCLHPFHLISVLNPEHFWCKLSSTSLSQSQESNVLSHSECKIATNFQGFVLDPVGEGLLHCPKLPGCIKVFLLATLVKKPAPPPKIAGYGTVFFKFLQTSPHSFCLVSSLDECVSCHIQCVILLNDMQALVPEDRKHLAMSFMQLGINFTVGLTQIT